MAVAAPAGLSESEARMFSAGGGYERFMGRWSRQLAPALVQGFLLMGPGRAGVAVRFMLALAAFPVIAAVVGGIQSLLWM